VCISLHLREGLPLGLMPSTYLLAQTPLIYISAKLDAAGVMFRLQPNLRALSKIRVLILGFVVDGEEYVRVSSSERVW
jgi:hypothetical protein